MKTEWIPKAEIAFIRRVGAYGAENVRIMGQLKQWAAEYGLMNEDAILYGIAWDDPVVTKSTECRYDVCLLLEEERIEETEDIKTGRLEGGWYAVLETEHTPNGMRDAWNEIRNRTESGQLSMDTSRPIMEQYAVGLVRRHRCELCVPIISR